MKHIRTNTDYHYISTVWLDVLGYWETQVFEKTDDQVDWSGVSTNRANEAKKAMTNHLNAIRRVILMESKR